MLLVTDWIYNFSVIISTWDYLETQLHENHYQQLISLWKVSMVTAGFSLWQLPLKTFIMKELFRQMYRSVLLGDGVICCDWSVIGTNSTVDIYGLPEGKNKILREVYRLFVVWQDWCGEGGGRVSRWKIASFWIRARSQPPKLFLKSPEFLDNWRKTSDMPS
jgi:hypothetical protein